jgi:hypothetical protein
VSAHLAAETQRAAIYKPDTVLLKCLAMEGGTGITDPRHAIGLGLLAIRAERFSLDFPGSAHLWLYHWVW